MQITKIIVTGFVKGVSEAIEVAEENLIDGQYRLRVGFDKTTFEDRYELRPFQIVARRERIVNVPDAREQARLEQGDCYYDSTAGCLMFPVAR